MFDGRQIQHQLWKGAGEGLGKGFYQYAVNLPKVAQEYILTIENFTYFPSDQYCPILTRCNLYVGTLGWIHLENSGSSSPKKSRISLRRSKGFQIYMSIFFVVITIFLYWTNLVKPGQSYKQHHDEVIRSDKALGLNFLLICCLA